jgi:glycyl-tRNA synthetase beta chain
VGDAALFEEVAALVEWPVAVLGSFDADFLALPREVVIATLTAHQRYFPVEDRSGALLPRFITVANIESREPERVREGNERVILPRLADAAFFWDTDRRIPLQDRLPALEKVVYQQGLGSTADRSRRVSRLAGMIAGRIGADVALAERAGLLAKCDLLTGMVGEFPELQGTMGRYYAEAGGEEPELAAAIEEQYWPRFAGDRIPLSAAGRCLAVADKLDSLCGIFAIGKKPSGNRDPFGLRRSALGIVRVCVEAPLDIDIAELVAEAIKLQPADGDADVEEGVYEFIVERLRAYVMDGLGVSAEMFEAVRVRRPLSLVDFVDRLQAVRSFVDLESATSLAAANKRIGNILRQAEFDGDQELREDLLADPAELDLFTEIRSAEKDVGPMVRARSYGETLTRLAALRSPVDRFFDDVMVMVDDEELRLNRLALLSRLRNLFLDVADISRLAIK